MSTNNSVSHTCYADHDRVTDVLVGRVRGVWGLRGHVKVEVLTDSPQRFSPGSTLYLKRTEVTVESSRSYRGGLLVKLSQIDDRTDAESVRDEYLTISANDVLDLPSDTFYHFQVIDMDVWTKDGEYLGKVKEILPAGSIDVYLIGGDQKEDALIPAMKEFVLEVNVKLNKMTINYPDEVM